MKFLKRIANNFIYRHTKKPKHYVHVDKPKTLQDKRQIQFNKWCRIKGVYCGSYLPKNPDKLNEKGKKGWIELKGGNGHRNFLRKSTNQKVRFDPKTKTNRNTIADEHYHWDIGEKDKKEFEVWKKDNRYTCRDRYGKICIEKSKQSHLAPLDKDYKYK